MSSQWTVFNTTVLTNTPRLTLDERTHFHHTILNKITDCLDDYIDKENYRIDLVFNEGGNYELFTSILQKEEIQSVAYSINQAIALAFRAHLLLFHCVTVGLVFGDKKGCLDFQYQLASHTHHVIHHPLH